MKPIHLNLAARPFRDYRPLYAVVVAASIVIAFLMLNNIDAYYRYVRETETTRNEISRIEKQIEQERTRTQNAQTAIKSIDLQTLGGQTRFINERLAERAFSWSELLDRLETVIPPNVRIISISPGFEPSGFVRLNLSCESKTADGMVQTIARFQQNLAFSRPFPSAHTRTPAGYTFGLTVQYRPSIARVIR